MNVKSKSSNVSLTLPRWHVMYSRYLLDDFSSKVVFPPSNPLNFLSASQTSARSLVKHIFIEQKRPKEVLQCKKQSKKCKFCSLSCSEIDPLLPYQYTPDNTKNAESDSSRATGSSPSEFAQVFGPTLLANLKEPRKTAEKKSQFIEVFEPALQRIARKRLKNRRNHIPKRLRKALKICHCVLKMIKKHKITYLIDVHCKIPTEMIEYLKCSGNTIEDEIRTLVQWHSPIHKVFLFLRSAIKKIFPLKVVWGSKKNECAFMTNLKMFLNCRRFDKITIKDMIKGITISDIFWLPGSSAETSFQMFIKWLVLDFIFALLKRFFYITEHSDRRNRLFYYRKDIWSELVLRGTKVIVDDGIWSPINSPCCTVQCKVRFCPKKLGLRPITTVVDDQTRHLMPAHEILSILRYICLKYPLLLGCSALGQKDVFHSWKSFWRSCVKYSRRHNTPAFKLYYAKMDVHRCFDTIPVELLLQIIREILDRTAHVEINHLIELKRKYIRVAHCSNEILKTLNYFLTNVRLDVMGKKFLKMKGIPQGWCLSSLLCNIFYGNLERNHLKNFINKHPPFADSDELIVKLLIRFTDDYMFVSSCKDETIHFIRKMQHGFKNYGFKINWKKTSLNFKVPQLDVAEASHITVFEEDQPFQWYGYLFPTIFTDDFKRKPSEIFFGTVNDVGVSIDLSRYSALTCIRDTITVAPSSNEYTIFSCLTRNLRLRINATCFDLEFNSSARVLRNAYELATLSSLQWLAHELCKSSENRFKCPDETLLDINILAAVFLSAIRKSLPGQRFPNRSMVIYIFFKAFYKNSIRYQTISSRISSRLLTGMKMHRKKLSKHRNGKHWNSLLSFATFSYPSHLKNITLQ